MLTNLNFLGIVQCPNGPFIICYDCQYIVGARGTLQAHLQKTHNLPPRVSIALLAARPDLTKIAPKTTRQLPTPWPNGVVPIQGLPVFPGYKCPHCSLCTMSEEVVQRHQHKEHQDYSKASYNIVQLQSWFSTTHGSRGSQWWLVDTLGPAPPV